MARRRKNGSRTQSVHQQLVGTLSTKGCSGYQDMLKDLLAKRCKVYLEAEMDDHLDIPSMTTRTKRDRR